MPLPFIFYCFYSSKKEYFTNIWGGWEGGVKWWFPKKKYMLQTTLAT